MTTEIDHHSVPQGAYPEALTPEILGHIATGARALDGGELAARDNVALLASAGLIGLGAPCNADGALAAMAAVISALAAECMSTAFSVWAHRMTIEYLTAAGTCWSRGAAEALLAGEVLGVTGMASAFKDAAGCGSLDVTAIPVDGGCALSGTLRWASNLYSDSIMVTAARTKGGQKMIVALPLSTPGVGIGEHFDLLALGSTASSYLTLSDAWISTEQVLSTDVAAFLCRVRPTFLVLQSAMCLGLAQRCLTETQAGLGGINAVFTAEVQALADTLKAVQSTVMACAQATGGPATPDKRRLLSMRLDAAEVASAAAALEIRTAGGKGYARRTDASRRFREAAFIPVQSPSESQLRWELSRCA